MLLRLIVGRDVLFRGIPVGVVNSDDTVPGWTLLPASVEVPELTSPWGLWVVDCVPLLEVIDKSAIEFYCKASLAKLIQVVVALF